MQSTLFELTDQPSTTAAAPRCRMCSRPAYWSQRTRQWSMYCASRACVNRQRLCQSCGGQFHINVDGAGTKYCSLDCKQAGYTIAYRAKNGATRCAWCNHEAKGVRRNSSAVWPYICRPCIDPIKHLVDRLKDHRVSHERVRQLKDDPGCEVCGEDLVAKVQDSKGRPRSRLVVDHDHNCCPGGKSCGRCVRGLICGTCNAAAGMMRDDPRLTRALAAYLERATDES